MTDFNQGYQHSNQPYSQGSHQQQYPQQPMGHPAPPAVPKKRRPLLVAAVAALAAVLVLAIGGYFVWENFVREDPGVAACRAMQSNGATDDASDGKKMTEAEYRKVRKQFEDSDIDKIREHGTALVDIVWQIDQMPEDEKMGALAFLAPIGTHISGLQTACADAGVVVNLNR